MNDNHLGIILNYELQELANNLWISKNKARLTIKATVLGIHKMWHWSVSYLKIIISIYLIYNREGIFFSTVQPATVPAAYWQRPGNGSGPGLLWHGTLWEAQGDEPAINPNPCIGELERLDLMWLAGFVNLPVS